MRKRIVIIIMLSLTCFSVMSQQAIAEDSLVQELITLNRARKLSVGDFDLLCDMVKDGIVPVGKVLVLRFVDRISLEIDSTGSLHRIYHDKPKGEICNGFYWILPHENSFFRGAYLFGVNSRLLGGLSDLDNSITGAPVFKESVYAFQSISAGFKQGLPECTWEYRISGSSGRSQEKDSIIYKYENYHAGLLDGDYTIVTNAGDTLYHTQFKEGTGYYKDYYPFGKVQMEGRVVKGDPEGRWLYHIYNEEGELTGLIYEIIENGKSVFKKEFGGIK